MTDPEWDAFVLAAENSGEWSADNAEWLRSILGTDSALKLFGELFEMHRQYERDIAVANLTTDAGVRAALKLQGEMAGIGKAIDRVRALTEVGEE